MDALWAEMMAEPRWLAIVGLFLDMIGAVLVAGTAWFRMTTYLPYAGRATDAAKAGPVTEEYGPLWRRRGFVIVGGLLLVIGFGLQIWATRLQMP